MTHATTHAVSADAATFVPAQPGATAVVVECGYSAGRAAPTLADVTVDRPAVLAWRMMAADRAGVLLADPVLATTPFYACGGGQGAVVEVLVPDNAAPDAPLRSRRHKSLSLEAAKRAALAEARARWRSLQRRAAARALPGLEIVAA